MAIICFKVEKCDVSFKDVINKALNNFKVYFQVLLENPHKQKNVKTSAKIFILLLLNHFC